MSLPYGLDLNNQINVDKSSTNVKSTLQTISSREGIALDARAKRWVEQNTTKIGLASLCYIGNMSVV